MDKKRTSKGITKRSVKIRSSYNLDGVNDDYKMDQICRKINTVTIKLTWFKM